MKIEDFESLVPRGKARWLTIYFHSFPAEERRPAASLLTDSRIHRTAIVTDAGHVAGLLTWWRLPSGVRYLEHFAIDASMRSSGIGSEALQRFLSADDSPVVLEIEPPTPSDVLTMRREAFYRRAGFHMLPYDYRQPSYGAGRQSIPLKLMATEEIDNPTAAIHSLVYGV